MWECDQNGDIYFDKFLQVKLSFCFTHSFVFFALSIAIAVRNLWIRFSIAGELWPFRILSLSFSSREVCMWIE